MSVCLVTGGAGFIGSHLCEYLLERGHKVICIDNLITGDLKNIKNLSKLGDFNFINKDICEITGLDETHIDYIYHLASPASPDDFTRLSEEILRVGSIGTMNMLTLAVNKRARILYASSSEVYGDAMQHPQSETYWGNCNPIGIRSTYDESKRFSEACMMAFHRKYDIDVRIARIFNTYGPKMRPDDGRVIPNFITQALKGEPLTIYGDGSQMRSFCYVSDMVKGLVKMMESDYHLPVNLGNPNEITIMELAVIICEIMNREPDYKFLPLPEDDPKRRLPDISVAKEILGWSPQVDIKDGLEKTVEHFSRMFSL